MTIQEARNQIESCETAIKTSYSNLRSDAGDVGTSAVSAASSTTTQRTAIPLSISLVGLILLAFRPIIGIPCIIAGIFIAYKAHDTAKTAQKKIMDSYRYLSSTIDSNTDI